MVKQYAVSFDRLRYVCMSFLWKDHLTGVLAPVVCWAVLCFLDCTSLVWGRMELDLSLVVFLLASAIDVLPDLYRKDVAICGDGLV